ncbi:MAG: NAD(P)H-dependent oxidoreductase [bacterium]
MKNLIIYYSRTGNTRKIAEKIKELTNWEIEEIQENKDRHGILGYFLSGRDATLKKTVEIKTIKNDLTKFDTIIIGTPVWAFNVSAPIRTFLRENKNNFKKIAFFCTMDGGGAERAFSEMETESGIKPIKTIYFTNKEIPQTQIENKLNEFTKEIK